MRLTRGLTHLGVLATTLAASIHHPNLASAQTLQVPLTEYYANNFGLQSLQEGPLRKALDDLLDAISVMQDQYFSLVAGTWPTAIDWTAAVMGTHVSSTLLSLVTGSAMMESRGSEVTCVDLFGLENLINRYFAHTTVFYYNENAFSLRNQAYDDMLWVVLGWLENIKVAETISEAGSRAMMLDTDKWHGLQFAPLAAHRARIFYELAEQGWDEQLCGGGMIWNPALEPYKNSITNELFAAASIAMYLYYPGDNNTSPFLAADALHKEHNPKHLKMAVKAYNWLREANLTNEAGLFHDGYHIRGWRKNRDGTVNPGTRRCDSLDKMVYTYNQGVILSASRGLWIATGDVQYLEDGHELIRSVIRATGWPELDRMWSGLGRGGVLEEFCDNQLQCSQDGQTFKGIFMNHLTEFCRPLSETDHEMIANLPSSKGLDKSHYPGHLIRCRSYWDWIEHNAEAALKTKNDDGLFGMWWGIPTYFPPASEVLTEGPQNLPPGTVDHINPPIEFTDDTNNKDLNDRGRGRTVETQSGGLAALRAKFHWLVFYFADYDPMR